MKANARLVTLLAAVSFLGISLAGIITPAAALTLDDVIRLKLAGVGEETILHVVEAEEAVFYLSVDEIIDLKETGASDDFIRALMQTPNQYGDRPAYREEYQYDDDDYVLDDYYDIYDPYGFDDYSTVFTHYYYDPFAYHWYVWPRFYVYYSPFWWFNAGTYYAGHWCRDWWDPWGSCVWYCDAHYGYSHYFGPSHTRAYEGRTWHRLRDATTRRVDRERQIYKRAGLSEPPTSQTRSRTVRASDGRVTSRHSVTRSGGQHAARSQPASRTVAKSGNTKPTRKTAGRSIDTKRNYKNSKTVKPATRKAKKGDASSRPSRSGSPAYRRARSPASSSTRSASGTQSGSAVSSHSSTRSTPSRARKR